MLLKMNITVYLGASSGNDDKFQIAVRELGNWIGENGHTLVYGGSKAGLMGDLAESVLLSGGKSSGLSHSSLLMLDLNITILQNYL